VPGILQCRVRSFALHTAADATTRSCPFAAAQAVTTLVEVAALRPLVATPTPVAVASIVPTTSADRIRLECIRLEYPAGRVNARVRALLVRSWHKAVTDAAVAQTTSRYRPRVLVIAATDRELKGVSGDVDTLVCGIGPVEAAVATARALAANPPRAVLHIGIAGARGFVEPELVLGNASIYCDAQSALVPATSVPDPTLLAAARSAHPQARVTAIGTSARIGGTAGCEIEAMEGFAVLRACELAGVPALEVRVTSNDVAEPDRARWRFDDAFALLAAVVPTLLKALDA
jgi:futalosine hydrolase